MVHPGAARVREAATGAAVARVLFRRNFLPYFVGNLVSNSGTWFQSIAQVLLVYRLTGSPFWVGVVNFSQFAAVIFLAPAAGTAADRFDRKRLVVAMQASAALLAGFLALVTAADRATTPIVIGVALALGVTTAMTTPALQAIVPALVTRSELRAAVALNAVTFNLSRALGPIAGVFVIARYGVPTAFTVNALSYLALVGGILLVDSLGERAPTSDRPRLRDSLRMVRAEPSLLAPVLIVGVVSLTADPVNTLTPVFATEVFGRPDTFTGYLVGAFGLGAVVAAFAVTGRRAPPYRLMVATLALMSLGMTAFALSANEAIALGGLFVGGFGYLSSVTAATSLLHLEVEDSHRGRVMALWSLSFHGSRPIGSLVDGAIASLAGLRVAGLVMVLPALSGCLGLALLLARSASRDEREPLRRSRAGGS
jgi:MFS family permease